MNIRKITGLALWGVGETTRIGAFMVMAYVILRSIVPTSSGAQPTIGPDGSVFVHTLALIGVAYLALTLRELGARLASNTRR